MPAAARSCQRRSTTRSSWRAARARGGEAPPTWGLRGPRRQPPPSRRSRWRPLVGEQVAVVDDSAGVCRPEPLPGAPVDFAAEPHALSGRQRDRPRGVVTASVSPPRSAPRLPAGVRARPGLPAAGGDIGPADRAHRPETVTAGTLMRPPAGVPHGAGRGPTAARWRLRAGSGRQGRRPLVSLAHGLVVARCGRCGAATLVDAPLAG